MIDLGVDEDAEIANAASDKAIEGVPCGDLPELAVTPEVGPAWSMGWRGCPLRSAACVRGVGTAVFGHGADVLRLFKFRCGTHNSLISFQKGKRSRWSVITGFEKYFAGGGVEVRFGE
jgi:hypothetical protein